HMDRFVIHAADPKGILTGTRLDEVASLEFNGTRFDSGTLTRADQKDELQLTAASVLPHAPSDQASLAHVRLKDARTLDVAATLAPARPKVSLVNKPIRPGTELSGVRLANPQDLPQDARLFFSLHTEIPEAFPRNEKIEVAAEDGSFSVLLSVNDGDIVLQ